jgi:hypothetical protein
MEADLTPYELDGVTFTGRCDRMETFMTENFGESVVIVDYKWGKSVSYEKGLTHLAERRHLADFLSPERESFNYGLQLSAYALLHGSAARVFSVAGVGFLGHGDGGVAGTFEPPVLCYSEPGKGQIKGQIKERTDEALEAMRCAAGILNAGRYEPCYAAETCRRCDMKGVCRKGELRGESLLAENEED